MYKEYLEIVGNGSPTGSVLEETIAVSVTKEMRREPEVPEERVLVEECPDGPARMTSKELAPIHSVKSDTLQNACSTRPRVVTDLGEKCSLCTSPG